MSVTAAAASNNDKAASALNSRRRIDAMLPEQRDQFLERPDVIGKAGFHRGGPEPIKRKNSN